MDNVTFEEEIEQPRRLATPKTSGLTAWIIRTGYAKDAKTAERLMILASAVALAVALGVLTIGGAEQSYVAPNPTDTQVPSMQYGS